MYYILTYTYLYCILCIVTVECAEAVRKYNVGIKCATITPDEARVEGKNTCVYVSTCMYVYMCIVCVCVLYR